MDRIPSPRTLTLDPNDENIILEIPEDKGPNNLSVLLAHLSRRLIGELIG